MDLADAGSSRTRNVENAWRDVDDSARRPYAFCNLEQRLARATSDIENGLPEVQVQCIDRGQAEERQLKVQQIGHLSPGTIRQLRR